MTRAPELHVNVLFREIADGDCLVAGQTAAHSYLFGLIRHGRDLDTRRQMLRQFSRMWAAITGQEARWFAENDSRPTELGMAT